MAIKSSLATSDIQAAVGNYTKGRSGKKVGKITIHHSVIAKATGKDIARVFTNPKRKASANYCVGYKRGDICCSLYEENRAWTSSSAANDNVAITMEVANSSVKYPYPVSDDTLANIIDLCVDICKRYNFRLNWTGDKNGTLTVHRFFANTACPGDYLYSKMPYIASEVNRRLDEVIPIEPTEYWTNGNYKIVISKTLRTSTSLITNNRCKVKNIDKYTQTLLTSKKPNDIAMFKVGVTIPIHQIIKKDGRIWGRYYNTFIVLCNKDGSKQALKIE